MEFKALDAGSGLATVLRGQGKVASTFCSVINIELEGHLCLSITNDRLDMAPNRIRLPEVVFQQLARGLDKRVMVSPLAVVHRTTSITWNHVSKQRPVTPFAIKPWAESVIASVLEEASGLPGAFFLGAAAGSLTAKCLETIKEFVADPSSAAKLVGLGFGFTPSGDDILVGFLALLNWAGLLPEHLCCAVMARARAGTNSLAFTSLYFAGYGLVQGYLHDVLCQLNGSRESLARAAVTLRDRVGSTSGGDLLLGVYIACRWVAAAAEGELPW